MAVYTQLGAEEMAALIRAFDVGALVSAKGIAEGVSNSNWLIETEGQGGSGARFILTMYEQRTNVAELPFFLGLLEHLNRRGLSCPLPVRNGEGEVLSRISGRTAALVTFLEGVWPRKP